MGRAKRCIRWLLVGTSLVVSGLCIAWVVGGAVIAAQARQEVAAEIRASRFVLVDDADRVRAELGVDQVGAGLNIYDEAGTLRVALTGSQVSAGLNLYDHLGTTESSPFLVETLRDS